jgi:signal transduction histidine kinase
MTTTMERMPATTTPAPEPTEMRWRQYGWLAAILGVAGAMWAVVASVDDGSGRMLAASLAAVWALTAVLLARRGERNAVIAGKVAAIGGVGVAWADFAPIAAGLLPAAGLYLLLSMPLGVLGSQGRRITAAVGSLAGLGVGLALFASRPDWPLWPVIVEIVVVLLIGFPAAAARYSRAKGPDRKRMEWIGWGITVAGAFALVMGGLHALVDWPKHVDEVAAAGTVVIPFGLLLAASPRARQGIDRVLTATISLAGLTCVVVAVYLAIVLGLGRVPRHSERTLLVLSMVAAGIAALLYLPAHRRLKEFAARLVYGERSAPDDVIRNFGSRLSRAIPLDELLLQLVESLRKTFGLTTAEVWRASGGSVERTVSDPDRGPAHLTVTEQEEATVARAGVSGPAWIKVWLPRLMDGREDEQVRVAPVTHSGELLGLIVVERPADMPAFDTNEESTLAELSRQVGLTLHNVRLDSALQESLDEVRRQAQALQESRARIVAASDTARRGLERNLHDGAQQHIVALAVKIRLVRQLLTRDPEKANTMLEELATDVEETLQELRDLAHGIYPPLLADKGIPEALASAARRSSLPITVEAVEVGRYPADVEAAVYFCCLEALQNAAKHAANASSVRIHVWEEAGGLLFEVADDGPGFDVKSRAAGAGFTNMSDRLGAIGGTLRVESAPGRGTKIMGTIPLTVTAQR